MSRISASRVSAPTLAVILVCAAILLRIVLACHPGLWGDEIFSLAMATGHSLEHPAASARGDLGDFVQPVEVAGSSGFTRFAEHEPSTSGVTAIVRAVRLSDTNPPLYYLLLGAWTRVAGTSDAALRFLSLFWAVLTLPVLWLLATELGDRGVGWSAVVLYAWSPPSMFYSLEGRMYSLVWLLATLLVWLTLRLARRGPGAIGALAWLGVAVAGLYTHYFFLFPWLACGAWLLVRTRGRARLAGVALLAAAAACAAPWYVQVPATLSQWRVTGTWLSAPLRWPETATRPFELAWSLLAGGSHWGGSPAVDGVLAVGYLCLALWLLYRRRLAELFTADRLLVWCWVAAVVLGPWVLDLARHTGASRIPRYVLAALPGALLARLTRHVVAGASLARGVHRLGAARLDRGPLAAAPIPPPSRGGLPGAGLRARSLGGTRRRGAGALGAVRCHRSQPRAPSRPAVPGLDRAAGAAPGVRSSDAARRPPPSGAGAGPQYRTALARRALAAAARSTGRSPGVRRTHRFALLRSRRRLSPEMRTALLEHRLVEISYFEPTAGGWGSPDQR